MSAARGWLRRHLRLVLACLALLLLALAGAIAASWHFSGVVIVPDHTGWPLSTRVDAVGRGRIVLDRNEESARPGVYGLDWQAGHAIAGAILKQDEETVTRRLRDVHGYLVPDMKVALDSHVYVGNPAEARGLPFRTVAVPDPLGAMPAWQIPPSPRSDRRAERIWAILVHGHNDDRLNGLRVSPEIRELGMTSLGISYRNDLGAPQSPDGLYHLGETEWRDLAAAVRYALRHGARRLVLFGWSMGGALIEQFMLRSPLAGRVAAVVFDAPVLDWRDVIEFNSEQMGLPAFVSRPVEWTIDARVAPDWDSLDALRHTGAFQLPVLLFHSTDDGTVPIADSEAFAAALPDWVTFYRVPGVDHTESWNADPRLYERRLARFLGPLFSPKSAASKEARPPGSGSK